MQKYCRTSPLSAFRSQEIFFCLLALKFFGQKFRPGFQPYYFPFALYSVMETYFSLSIFFPTVIHFTDNWTNSCSRALPKKTPQTGAAKGGSHCISCQRHLQQFEQQPAVIGHTETSYSQSLKTSRSGLSLCISCCKGLRASRVSSEAKPGTAWLLLAECNGARTLLWGNLERHLAGGGRTGFKRLRLQLPLGI